MKYDIGKRFGLLTVTGEEKQFITKGGYAYLRQMCKCDCGNLKNLNSGDLKSNKIRSCGCLKKEEVSKRFKTHGFSKNKKVYTIWKHIIQRCTNEKCKNYIKYGAIGITVCKRWLKFENFLKDMGEPKDNQSIDRINNNKGYTKSNCRWATSKEQCRNKKFNVHLTINNETKCVAEWAEIYGICKNTIYQRIKRGLTHEQCIFGE